MSVIEPSLLQNAVEALHSTGEFRLWQDENRAEPWQNSVDSLTSQSSLEDFATGTGRTIFTASLLPAILSAKHEVILSTCFWAPGPTLDSLVATLKALSQRIRSNGEPKVRVYICFSSRSFWQKLFHTSSPNGHVYAPETWARSLGLPWPSEIPGLELRVQSIFFRPFSVLHSKYLIIDRQDVWLPSCNVSWEEWYECSIHLRGIVVEQVFAFWKRTWDLEDRVSATINLSQHKPSGPTSLVPGLYPFKNNSFPNSPLLPTTLLPHAQHSAFKHINWLLPTPSPPFTPLNTTLQRIFSQAQRSISLLTPNLTSPPVYAAIISALRRGISIRIITNRRMMILEQLLTSGSVTEYWIWKVARMHRRLVSLSSSSSSSSAAGVGALSIEYFCPSRLAADPSDVEDARGIACAAVKTHIKLTMVDGEIAVLGSGNMDRASWYTSQELGVMLQGREAVGRIWSLVESGLDGVLERYY